MSKMGKRRKIAGDERKALVKKLDKVFSLYIRKRDKRCVQCGTRERLTCGHLIHRTKMSVRFDEVNCHCQCSSCNYLHEWHAQYFTAWWIKKYGERAYQELVARSNQIKKWTAAELQELIKHYTNALTQLGGNK